MKKKIETPSMDKYNLSFKNLAAFTLAEILLSLTVIGIVAAIALPSLLGNANERAWETQKKALYTRFSQALPLLPSLNGYGQLEGTLSSNSDNGEQHVDIDTAAETFVRDGLSKVMKITNICDSEHLTDCGLPEKIIPINGNSALELSNLKSIAKLNPTIISSIDTTTGLNLTYEQLDTKAAAFETVNGESVLVYYNPNCEANLKESERHFLQPKVCANFVYDLNGKKGPNTVGKDVGFITALYSTDSIVVAPNPNTTYENNLLSYDECSTTCREKGLKMPTIDELNSMFYNTRLLGYSAISYDMWSNSFSSSNMAWIQGWTYGRIVPYIKSSKHHTWCVKR